jgi:hypothetical protein
MKASDPDSASDRTAHGDSSDVKERDASAREPSTITKAMSWAKAAAPKEAPSALAVVDDEDGHDEYAYDYDEGQDGVGTSGSTNLFRENFSWADQVETEENQRSQHRSTGASYGTSGKPATAPHTSTGSQAKVPVATAAVVPYVRDSVRVASAA